MLLPKSYLSPYSSQLHQIALTAGNVHRSKYVRGTERIAVFLNHFKLLALSSSKIGSKKKTHRKQNPRCTVFHSTVSEIFVIYYPGSEFEMIPALICTLWRPTCFNKFSLANMDQLNATLYEVPFERIIFSFFMSLVFIILLYFEHKHVFWTFWTEFNFNKLHCK